MNAPTGSALDRAFARMDEAIATQKRRHTIPSLKRGARALLADPAWMTEFLGRNIRGAVPVSISARLAVCGRELAKERGFARNYPHIYSSQHVLNLRTCSIALRWQRRHAGPEVVPVHELEAA